MRYVLLFIVMVFTLYSCFSIVSVETFSKDSTYELNKVVNEYLSKIVRAGTFVVCDIRYTSSTPRGMVRVDTQHDAMIHLCEKEK